MRELLANTNSVCLCQVEAIQSFCLYINLNVGFGLVAFFFFLRVLVQMAESVLGTLSGEHI